VDLGLGDEQDGIRGAAAARSDEVRDLGEREPELLRPPDELQPP
jgi:hypothetical protein